MKKPPVIFGEIMNYLSFIISFSGRKSGNCEQICDFIKEIIPGQTAIFRFSGNPVHGCGGCEYQCFEDIRLCPYFEDSIFGLLRGICLSDQVIFLVPNYCDYPCSNFFIFNERCQVYFQDHPEGLLAYEAIPKKFIVISNSQSENFSGAFDYHCAVEPDILYLSPGKYGKESLAGDLLESEQARRDIRQFILGSNPDDDASATVPRL